jgi:hypothetical protein
VLSAFTGVVSCRIRYDLIEDSGPAGCSADICDASVADVGTGPAEDAVPDQPEPSTDARVDVATIDLSNGVLARWTFDETTAGAPVVDIVGNQSGTPRNAPAPSLMTPPVAFSDARSLAFDSTQKQVVDIATKGLPRLEDPKSITFWLWYPNIPSTSADAVWLADAAHQNGLQIGILLPQSMTNTVVAAWKWQGLQYIGSAMPAPKTWHHIGYTFDGATHLLYVDGALAATATFAIQGSVDEVHVGAYPGSNEYLNGNIDDLRMYGRVLDSAAMAALARGEG